MKRRFDGSVCVLLFLLLTAGVPATAAHAGEARTHDGFFLRLAPGLGTGSASIEDTGDKLEFSGGLSDGDIAIGGRVRENLLLHGTIWGWILSDPKGEASGPGGSLSADVQGSLYLSAFGGGLTYYLMPANVYFTGSLGYGALRSELEDPLKGDTDSGLAFTLGVGKEWWVGDAWGLGVAGGFSYLSAKNKDIVLSSESWSGLAYSLRFSATFN
jgi:hypothetical protein